MSVRTTGGVTTGTGRWAQGGRLGLLLGMLYGPVTLGVLAASVALPFAGAAAGTATMRTWLVSAYAAALGVGTAVAGRAIDWWGIRACLGVGCVCMVAGAAVCAAADSTYLLLAGRVVLAVGSAAVVVVTVSLAAAERVGQAVAATLASVTALWVSSATLVGGVVTAVFGWRAALVLPALSVVMAPAVIVTFRSEPARRRGRVDGVGVVLLTVCAAAILVLLLHGRLLTAPAAVALAVAAAVSGVGLWRWTRHRPDSIVPSGVVGRALIRICLVGACVYGTLFGVIVIVAQTLATRGWEPMAVGAALAPGAVAGAVLVRRWCGSAETALVVCLVAVAAVAAAAALPWSVLPVVTCMAVVAFVAFGFGQVVLVRMLADVDARHRSGVAGLVYLAAFAGGGVGAGAVTTVRGVGAALGVVAAMALCGAAVVCARRVGGEEVGSGQ